MTESPSYELPARLDGLLGLVSKIYAQDSERSLQELLVNAKVRIVEGTGYDGWNGGQYGHEVYLVINEDAYVPILKSKSEVERRIREDLNRVNDVPNEYVDNVYLQLEQNPDADWRNDSGLLSSGPRVVPQEAEFRIWQGARFRVFLSHKTEVKRKVGELKERLAVYGIGSFVAHEDIHPTQVWQNEIEAALETADAFVAVLTEKFHDSFWTDQEIGFALARRIPMIALRLGRDPYGFISRFQALTCAWEEAPVEIVKILLKQDRMVGAYIGAVRSARNFDEANKLADMLAHIQRISEEAAKLLVDAYNSNSEVRGGFGFNGQRPRSYGDGLVSHLNRLGILRYEYGKSREILRT